MTKGRIRHYDIAKGLGIILVVMGHSMIEFGHYIIYMFHMPLFFFLSGVFFKPALIKNQLRKQSRNLLVPMAFFICVIMILAAISGDFTVVSLKPPHLQGMIGPLWFLWALFVIILTHNLMVNYSGTIVALLVAIALTVVGYVADCMQLANYLYIYSCMSLLVFYTLGSILGRCVNGIISRHAITILLISVAILVGIYILSYKVMHLNVTDLFSNQHSENYLIWFCGAAAGIIMVLSASVLFDRLGIAAGMLALIGESSLYVFAFHFVVLHLLHHVVPNPTVLEELAIVTVAVIVGLLLRYPLRLTFPVIFK